MQERSATVIGVLVLLLLLFPLGWLVHVSPRFPGSLPGSLIGILGAALILLASAYALVRRVPRLHRKVTRRVPARTLLALHIYLGLLGAMLALIHGAHKFNSPLGLSLTGALLLVLISGYVGRYVLSQVAKAVRARQSDLAVMKAALAEVSHGQDPRAVRDTAPRIRSTLWRRLLLVPAETPPESSDSAQRAAVLASSIADLEFAIRSEGAANRLFSAAVVIHVVLSIIFLALLALHIWAGLYYGLRWL